MKKISLVTPCYNEEAGIRHCYETCRRVMEDQLGDYSYEHILSTIARRIEQSLS